MTTVEGPTLTVYGAPWCPHCKRVKKFLAAHRVPYNHVDIGEHPEAIERLKELQREIHEDFIALVKSRRGGKLAGPENDLFSGEYWTGRRGIELGLVDSIGEVRSTLRDRFGDKVFTPLIAAERRLFGRRVSGIGRGDFMGAGLAEDVISALEARALWARYGL